MNVIHTGYRDQAIETDSPASEQRSFNKSVCEIGGTSRRDFGVEIVRAPGEEPALRPGTQVRVETRVPIGHYRVPSYLRGKSGRIETVIQAMSMDNEEEGYGRNAGNLLHYYRVSFPMQEIWPHYVGSAHDRLLIEVFETWLERS